MRRRLDDDGELSIRVFASTEVIGSVVGAIYRNAAWMGLAAWLLLILTIAILINRTLTRPLRELDKAMGEVSEGFLSTRLAETDISEVGLSRAG